MQVVNVTRKETNKKNDGGSESGLSFIFHSLILFYILPLSQKIQRLCRGKNLDKPRSHFLKSHFVLKVENKFGTKLLLFTFCINSYLELNHRRRSLTLFCFLLVGGTIGTSKAKGWPVKQSLVSVGSEVRWGQRNLCVTSRYCEHFINRMKQL